MTEINKLTQWISSISRLTFVLIKEWIRILLTINFICQLKYEETCSSFKNNVNLVINLLNQKIHQSFWYPYLDIKVISTMSYFSKWKRNGPASVQPVVPRGRSQSLGVDALERSGIRALEQYVSFSLRLLGYLNFL